MSAGAKVAYVICINSDFLVATRFVSIYHLMSYKYGAKTPLSTTPLKPYVNYLCSHERSLHICIILALGNVVVVKVLQCSSFCHWNIFLCFT